MTRLVQCAALALALGAPAALANDFIAPRPSDSFTYVDTATGQTVTSQALGTSPDGWSLWRQFAGLGDRWVHLRPTSDVVTVWMPSLSGSQRFQALPSLAGPVGAQRSVNLGSGLAGTMRVVEVNGQLATPAGTFTGVTRLDLTGAGGALMSIWAARDVGVVQWSRGASTYSLKAAVVDGAVYPAPAPPPVTPPVTPTTPLGPASFRDFVALEVAPGEFEGDALDVGDLNGDGLTDIAVVWRAAATPAPTLSVFHQSPGGALDAPVVIPLTAGSMCDSIDVADVTGDGRDDVVLGFWGAVQVLAQTASGALAPQAPISCQSRWVAAGDVDGDGRNDVVGIGWSSNTYSPIGLSVLLQDGQGQLAAPFIHPVNYNGYNDLEVADVTGDGRSDVIVLSGQGYGHAFAVIAQDGAGKLLPAAYYDLPVAQENARGVGVGDVNGDGRHDVVVSYGGNSPRAFIAVYEQDATGRLVTPAPAHSSYDCPEPVEVADLDGDGRGDIVAVNGGWNALSIWTHDTGGLRPHFRVAVPYATHYDGQGLVIADVNSDGRLDLLTANYNYGLIINYGQ